jgi:hypothetical protein
MNLTGVANSSLLVKVPKLKLYFKSNITAL